MSNDHELAALDRLPEATRIRSRKLAGGVATIVADASGLSTTERQGLERRLKDAALLLPGVSDARIALTAARPNRTLVAIGSGKGGVGKSTLTANLAVALAAMGKKVGLIDADIYGPSQPTLFGTSKKPEAEGEKLIPVEVRKNVSLLSVGQLVSAETALAWRGPMATSALNQLIEGDWGDTDLILVDLPPGTGDVQLSLVQKARPAGAVIISTPQDLSLIDARRAIDLFGKTSVPVLGVVENMAGYQCPHCGESSDPFGQGGAEQSAARLGVPFLGRLPLSASLRTASDAGVPPAGEPGPAADAFRAIAERLLDELEKVSA
ncbi:MAG: Mrp/NBP35 family ATP-binding protein [Sphingomonas sp.]|nr:Mrp/NBP35 family ATP-binding protein [Sphingomonas sp.]